MAMPIVWPRPRKKENIETAAARFFGSDAACSWVCRAGNSLQKSRESKAMHVTGLKDLRSKPNARNQVRKQYLGELCIDIDSNEKGDSDKCASPASPYREAKLAHLAD